MVCRRRAQRLRGGDAAVGCCPLSAGRREACRRPGPGQAGGRAGAVPAPCIPPARGPSLRALLLPRLLAPVGPASRPASAVFPGRQELRRAQLAARMLLLLLGIIVLHVAVLVLLFVSTIVSVSGPRAAGGGRGTPSPPPQVLRSPRGDDSGRAPSSTPPRCYFADNVKSQTAVSGNLPPSSCFEKTGADSGVGRKQSLDWVSCAGLVNAR